MFSVILQELIKARCERRCTGMKSVLISIQPKWCELIASGKKIVEVRKTRPKINTPFKCYIYQTKLRWVYTLLHALGFYATARRLARGIGKVIGEFWCYEIIDIKPFGIDDMQKFENQTCLKANEIVSYLDGFYGYGWQISNLVIYDKPKELSEFSVLDGKAIKECKHRERVYQNPDYVNGAWLFGGYVCNKGEIDWCCDCKRKPLKRPPQSWYYVNETVKGGASDGIQTEI